MTMPAIELEGLTKRYGTRPVLDGLDLRIDGGIVALLGPNGAGKTTLVQVLATLVRPDAGDRPGARARRRPRTAGGAAT